MSPYPLDPVRAVGPLRLVLTTYPSREAALPIVDRVLARKLAACANLIPADSRYWWHGSLESASEVVVLFKTVPKRVGALFRFLGETHPYAVPELAEVDVPRVGAGYLGYLASTLDPAAAPVPLRGGARRREGRQGRGGRRPGRTRARRRPPSR